MRYRIEHITRYSYSDDVTDSYGRMHLSPRELPWQRVLTHEVRVDPPPSDTGEHLDVYGNTIRYFQVTEAHRELVVTGVTELEIDAPDWTGEALDQPWESARPIGSDAEDAWSATDFTFASRRVSLSPLAREYAAQSFPPGRGIGEALLDLMHRVHADFDYRPGSTTVATTVDDLMAGRHGVCQDFSHVMISGLRGLGLAVRYVSGYLATTPPPGRPRLVGADATHAWVACWVPHFGWLHLDPTNNRPIDASHAIVAWGRDYDDVTPVKGIIFTEAKSSSMKVGVDMAPIEPGSHRR